MTKAKEKTGKSKNGQKGKGGGHHVNVPPVHHSASEAEKRKKDNEPFIFGTGELEAPHHVALSENLSNKDRHKVEKLEAMIEYEEAHNHPDEAEKLRQRIADINEKAETKVKAGHDDPVKVIHSGGHKHHHREHDT